MAVLARKNVTRRRSRTIRVMQPRLFVRAKATRVVLRAERPARTLTRTPRTAWPDSVRHAVTRAKRRLPRRTFFTLSASWTGSRTKDVLCAAFPGFGVAVPGVYGMKSAFHG